MRGTKCRSAEWARGGRYREAGPRGRGGTGQPQGPGAGHEGTSRPSVYPRDLGAGRSDSWGARWGTWGRDRGSAPDGPAQALANYKDVANAHRTVTAETKVNGTKSGAGDAGRSQGGRFAARKRRPLEPRQEPEPGPAGAPRSGSADWGVRCSRCRLRSSVFLRLCSEVTRAFAHLPLCNRPFLIPPCFCGMSHTGRLGVHCSPPVSTSPHTQTPRGLWGSWCVIRVSRESPRQVQANRGWCLPPSLSSG